MEKLNNFLNYKNAFKDTLKDNTTNNNFNLINDLFNFKVISGANYLFLKLCFLEESC